MALLLSSPLAQARCKAILLSLSEEWGQFSHSCDPGASSLLPQYCRQEAGMDGSPTLMLLGPAHLHPPCPEPAVVCCPRDVQGPLSLVLQQVRDRDNSPALMTLAGLALPPATREGGEVISPSPTPLHSRQEASWLSHPHALKTHSIRNPYIQGQLYYLAQVR